MVRVVIGGMNIALVIFIKCVVVAVGVALVERWNAYRKTRPIMLKQGRNGTYTPRDWTCFVDRAGRFIAKAFIASIFALWAFVIVAFLADGQEGLRTTILAPLY